MDLLDQLAESRIEEAIARGVLDDLPGAGEPLVLDDDSSVPETLRAAYRLLKNSGYLPPEVSIQSQIKDIEAVIGRLQAGEERAAAAKRLSLLRARLGSERCGNLNLHGEYVEAVAEKLGHE